jgi:hypothetical protein
MLEFHDPIPEITGQTCTALVAQQYWHCGKLVDEANVLFLKLEGRLWHRFFIDGGVVFWRTVDAPDHPGEEGDHRYTHTDIGAAQGFAGKELKRVSTADLPGGGEMRLEFRGAPTLIFRNVDDRSHLILET